MPIRERPANRGQRRARSLGFKLSDDLRAARVSAGLSQRAVAEALGVSHSLIGRFERHAADESWLEFVSGYAAVVGLEVSLRTYPGGDPIRDRAQLALLERLRVRLHPSLRWRTEVPIPIERDLRAWDAVIGGRTPTSWQVRVEAETNVADVQAVERRLRIKTRDDPGGHLILLLSDTRANRMAIAALREGLRDLLPCRQREILGALNAGREPPGGGIVML
jgi:transcriptional regulator with XRE-family HTH domain